MPVTKGQTLHASVYMRGSRVIKFMNTESRMVVARGWGPVRIGVNAQ
jgi:hypothetical protein